MMNTKATLEQMQELRLQGMAQSYEAILALPAHQHPEAHQMLAQLIQQEKNGKALSGLECICVLANSDMLRAWGN